MQEKGQSLEAIAPFNDSFSLYLFKKTEKIVLALYLVTDHLSDTEAMRTSIRRLANDVLRGAIKVTSTYASVGSDERMVRDLYELTSFLELAATAKLISSNNAHVIVDEVSRLAKDIRAHQDANQSGANLKKSFFVVDTLPQTNVLYKGHKGQAETKMSFTHTANSTATPEVKKQNVPATVPKQNKIESPIKDNRTERIKAIVQEKGQVTIKDVADAFTGIGEKTIQRELQKMVATGVLKREGERRWSTYSLR